MVSLSELTHSDPVLCLVFGPMAMGMLVVDLKRKRVEFKLLLCY